MPVTFATYAIGMLALSGFPLLFSGFWSKDEILHAAHLWSISHWPFYLGLIGALLTAFYMTRQVFYVFFGNCRLALGKTTHSEKQAVEPAGLPAKEHPHIELPTEPHESPPVMTLPLVLLAAFSILLGFIGTPVWPWFQAFLSGEPLALDFSQLGKPDFLATVLLSTVVVLIGLGAGYWLYGRKPVSAPEQPDALECFWPNMFSLLRQKYFVDEAYEWAIVGLNAFWARACDWLDRWVWEGVVQVFSYITLGLAWLDRTIDEFVINLGFDEACQGLSQGGRLMSLLQDGRVQHYLRLIGVGLGVLTLFLVWGCAS